MALTKEQSNGYMDYERIRNFILSYTSDNGGVLCHIRKKAEDDGVPIIRKDTEDFLKVMIRMIRPKRILEIGTAVGYSSIFFAEMLQTLYKEDIMDKTDGANITKEATRSAWSIDTCELDKDRIETAKKNIDEAGYSDRITIHEGDACDSLKKLIEEGRKYDLIFIDAAKAQYMDYINLSMKLSDKNATIITDNIFGDGDVLESHFLVDKRDRTIHDRMREYVYYITHSDGLETALVPIGDGLAVSIVNKEITEGDIG